MSYLLETREIGDYRISVYQDEWADCPCHNICMAGIHIWTYSNDRWLHPDCDWQELFGKYDDRHHDMEKSLKELVCEYVPEKKIIEYINSDVCKKQCRMRYDKSEHMWHLEYYGKFDWTDELWHTEESFTPSELRDYDNREIFCRVLDEDDFTSLLQDCKDIAFCTWSSSGYSQGSYANGFTYCDKERFSKMCDKDTTNWRQRALDIFNGEVREIEMWMWGDVKGYVLEKKLRYKKVFTEIQCEPEDSFDWEEIDSCWEYYLDTEDLIDVVISEHDICKEDAA